MEPGEGVYSQLAVPQVTAPFHPGSTHAISRPVVGTLPSGESLSVTSSVVVSSGGTV